jgi:anti-sigma factor RsiW
MNCEEFEILGLDSQRDGSVSVEGRQRAVQHARVCGRCAALGASWSAAQEELAALAESSRMLRVPARVETRLLQQFRLKHQPRQERRFLQLATWGLVAAILLVCTFGVWDWHKWQQGSPNETLPITRLRHSMDFRVVQSLRRRPRCGLSLMIPGF